MTLAPQKYSPSTLAQQLSSASVNADLDRSNNAVKSILKDQNFSLNITSQIAKLPSYGNTIFNQNSFLQFRKLMFQIS